MLKDVTLQNPDGEGFPFDLAILRKPVRLGAVTVVVGENGCGKSTLLEAIAYAAELPVVGTEQSVERDETLGPARELGDALRLGWSARSKRGFFLRAEDYFGFVKRQNAMKASLRADEARVREENAHLPSAELDRITGPFRGSLAATEARYGRDLDGRSHGESFLDFFVARLRGAGLYVLDEPEVALSPLRQLAFLSLVRECEQEGGQFLIATHAPIVMAYPGATLLEAGDDGLSRVGFDDVEHVRTFRQFLDSPEAFTRHL